MRTIKIHKLQNNGSTIVIATCTLVDGKVQITGDHPFVDTLEGGISLYTTNTPELVYPSDGEIFMDQLKHRFKSGYCFTQESEIG